MPEPSNCVDAMVHKLCCAPCSHATDNIMLSLHQHVGFIPLSLGCTSSIYHTVSRHVPQNHAQSTGTFDEQTPIHTCQIGLDLTCHKGCCVGLNGKGQGTISCVQSVALCAMQHSCYTAGRHGMHQWMQYRPRNAKVKYQCHSLLILAPRVYWCGYNPMKARANHVKRALDTARTDVPTMTLVPGGCNLGLWHHMSNIGATSLC